LFYGGGWFVKKRNVRIGLIALLAGAFFSLVVYSQSPPLPLPEGTSGIAASYPNDIGIAGDARVVFADGFDGYTSLSEMAGNYNGYHLQSNFALDTSLSFGGSKSLRIRMPQTNNDVFNALTKTISSSRDKLFLRAYVRYEANYAGIRDAHNGIRISGNYPGPGRIPTGRDFFLVTLENSRYQGEAEPGYTHAYVYHPEQNDQYGEHWHSDGTVSNGAQSFGPFFVPRPKTIAPRGVWVCQEMLVQMNTPGSRDGRVAFWENGILIADWQNVRFRDVTTVKINQIQLKNGGKSSTQQNDKWYDNLVVATSYIGPVSTTGPRPGRPTNLRIIPDQ
jgi:hypothetical protein